MTNINTAIEAMINDAMARDPSPLFCDCPPGVCEAEKNTDDLADQLADELAEEERAINKNMVSQLGDVIHNITVITGMYTEMLSA